MKEKFEKPEDAGAYSPETHPFGRPERELPELDTRGRRFSYWLKNKFWYHYKWYVLAGCALAALAVVLIYDMVSNKRPDFQFVLASNHPVLEQSTEEMVTHAQELFGDLNGDGESYCVGQAMYMSAEGEMGVAMYSKMTTLFVDADIRFFMFDDSLKEMYFTESEGFLDLSALGYEAVPGTPWLVELTGLPLLERAYITQGRYFAAVQQAKRGDKAPEESQRRCLEFLDLLLTTP